MNRVLFLTLIVIALLVSGCGTPEATTTQLPDSSLPATEVATATTVAEVPSATTVSAASCTYAATLVSEDPLDGQQFNASDSFKKTWTFINSGTCAWDASKLLLQWANAPGDTRLSSGQTPAYQMDFNSNPQKSTVAVGETISVYLDLQAPDHAGTFIQNWQIVDANNGQSMPITYTDGTSGQTVYVQIVVPDASGGGTNSGQNPSIQIQYIELQQGSQACTFDAQYNVSAKITGAPNSEVSYLTHSNNNSATGTGGDGGTITLDHNGEYDLFTSIRGPFSAPADVQVYIEININGQPVNYAYDFICEAGVYQQ